MKRITALLLCGLLLSGCVFPGGPAETAPTESQVENATQSITAPATDPVTQPQTEPATEAVTVPALPTVTIYYGNENADGLLTTEVQVKEIDMHILVDQLIAHGVLAEDVKIQGLAVNGSTLYMDFNSAFAIQVSSLGTSGEYILIGSVVNTFLDAFGADSVYFTVDNEILESGHNIYDFELTRYN